MAFVQKIRRYNMNDIPPGASPVQRAIGPQSSGITLPAGGTTAVATQFGGIQPGLLPQPTSVPQAAVGATGSSGQTDNLRGYSQGEFRKIKQSLDSMEAQFVADEMTVANLPGQVFRFWTFATGSDIAVAGGPANVGYPANQTITKLRGDTTLFIAMQMAFTPTAASNTNDLLVQIDGITVVQGQFTATLNLTGVADVFAVVDSHFHAALLTVGNHTVNVQVGTSANATTFGLSGANLWVWEQLMPAVTFQ